MGASSKTPHCATCRAARLYFECARQGNIPAERSVLRITATQTPKCTNKTTSDPACPFKFGKPPNGRLRCPAPPSNRGTRLIRWNVPNLVSVFNHFYQATVAHALQVLSISLPLKSTLCDRTKSQYDALETCLH